MATTGSTLGSTLQEELAPEAEGKEPASLVTRERTGPVPASAESLVACDYEGARLLAGREHGGGCENDADLACIDASVGFRLRPRSVGKWFLSCSAGTRCARGGLRLLADPLSLIAALHTKGATAPPGVVRVSRSSEESLFVLLQATTAPTGRRSSSLSPSRPLLRRTASTRTQTSTSPASSPLPSRSSQAASPPTRATSARSRPSPAKSVGLRRGGG